MITGNSLQKQYLKIQFHAHTRRDPVDNIKHSEIELIDAAARYGFNVLSITCHNRVVFNEDLRQYAAQRGILLIPGIEKSIGRRHVLIINANPKAQKIHTFKDLADYKKANPQCLIIAPHPYYPAWICLRKKLEENIQLFDAIEYSWFHSKKLDLYNKKAVKMAKKYNLPVIATSDNHILKYINYSYSLVEAKINLPRKSGPFENQKNIAAVFGEIKKNRIQIVSRAVPWCKLFTSFCHVELRFLVKRFWLRKL